MTGDCVRESAPRTGVVVQESPSTFEFTVGEVGQLGRTLCKGMRYADSAEDVRIVANAL